MELDKIPWGDLGPPGLIALFILLLFTGKIVTRAALEDMREQRDFFKQAWVESQATVQSMDERVDANTDALRSVEQALRAITEGDRRN